MSISDEEKRQIMNELLVVILKCKLRSRPCTGWGNSLTAGLPKLDDFAQRSSQAKQDNYLTSLLIAARWVGNAWFAQVDELIDPTKPKK